MFWEGGGGSNLVGTSVGTAVTFYPGGARTPSVCEVPALSCGAGSGWQDVAASVEGTGSGRSCGDREGEGPAGRVGKGRGHAGGQGLTGSSPFTLQF